MGPNILDIDTVPQDLAPDMTPYGMLVNHFEMNIQQGQEKVLTWLSGLCTFMFIFAEYNQLYWQVDVNIC